MGPLARRQRRRRVAVVGGGIAAAKAHHDSKEAQQQEEEEVAAAQQAAPAETGQGAPAPAPDGLTPEVIEELKELGELHDQNVLTDEEFQREKARLLDSG